MAEMSLKDRLQPALLDRLTDDDRLVTVYRITLDKARLDEQRLTEQDVERALGLQGLRRVRESAGGNGPIVHEYVAAGGSASARHASMRSLRIRLANDTHLPLTSVASVEASTVVNAQLESPERRAMSMTRLREAVLRDLRWLFNASGIDDAVDLEPYPEVRRSVVNYGLRSLAGKAVTSIDAVDMARRIRDAIAFFEPRLSQIVVTPEKREEDALEMTLAFLVEAELWGQPLAQHVSLRTSIDVDTGDVRIADRASRS